MGSATSGDGTLIAYRRTGGDGPPVIMVGGAFSTAETEAPLASLLAPRFSVVTYDRRGRGGSGDRAPYAVEHEIADLAALLEEVGGSACVYGTSSGAALALEAAATGLPITQLAVYEPPYEAGAAVSTARAGYPARLGDLLARGLRDEAVELSLAMVGTTPDEVARMRGAAMWQGLTALAHTLVYDHAVVGPGPVPVERLARITARAMVVEGGASPPPTRAAARAVADALPRGRQRTLTGQVHTVAPHVLAPVLAEFFAEAA
ncbi:alpha/beta fold hydrolase [Streptomyces sp. NBC_01498]|uniref:alpha/beta fold hydrolase n=1 Tax=Streptomyces sp. NBC_01498 TaxID=2975870 RepID=UPI003FCCC41F